MTGLASGGLMGPWGFEGQAGRHPLLSTFSSPPSFRNERLPMAKVADRFNLALEDGNWEPVITKDQIILKEPETDGVFPNWCRVA